MSWRTSIATAAVRTGFGPLLYTGRLAEAARVAAELGHEGVEVALKSPQELDAAKLQSLLSKYGLKLVAIGSGRGFLEDGLTLADADKDGRERAVRRVTDLIDYGAGFGAPVIIGLVRGRDASAEARKRLTETMGACADHAAALGQDVLVEPINRYETPVLCTTDDSLRFLAGLQRDNVKLLLDAFHMNIEEVSIAAAIRQAGDLLGHFHAADSNRRAAGMGHIDYEEITTALHDIGYRGWLSAEVLPLPDDYSAARQARQFCRSLSNHVYDDNREGAER
jgi:sugar phosphate isomerase/epimerase